MPEALIKVLHIALGTDRLSFPPTGEDADASITSGEERVMAESQTSRNEYQVEG